MSENEKIDAIEIDDSEMDKVVGGAGRRRKTHLFKCSQPKCGNTFTYFDGETNPKCPNCQTVYHVESQSTAFV